VKNSQKGASQVDYAFNEAVWLEDATLLDLVADREPSARNFENALRGIVMFHRVGRGTEWPDPPQSPTLREIQRTEVVREIHYSRGLLVLGLGNKFKGDLNAVTDPPGVTPLFHAVAATFQSSQLYTQALLAQGADPDLAARDGYSPRQWACAFRQLYYAQCSGKLFNQKCWDKFNQLAVDLRTDCASPVAIPAEKINAYVSHRHVKQYQKVVKIDECGNPYNSVNLIAAYDTYGDWCEEGLKECTVPRK
jgi:hypothetical protein